MQFYVNVFQKNNKIYHRGYRNGERFIEEIKYKPYLFIPGDGEYKTIYGESLEKKTFNNIKKAREFIDIYDGASNATWYGIKNWGYQFLNDAYPGKIEYDPSLISIVSLDIEVSSKEGMPNIQEASQPITAITLTRNGKTITFGTKDYHGKHNYFWCDNEKDLLGSFLEHWTYTAWAPDVVTGWSVDLFDIPYLINRTRNLLGEEWVNKFSPLGVVNEREIIRSKAGVSTNNFQDRVEKVYEIAGIAVLDYLQLYKKFATNARESYKLDSIAALELGQGKHDYSDVGTLDDLYEQDFDRYIDYNVQDAVLVEKLEKKLNYLQQVFQIAYKAKVNFIDTMTTSRPWDAIIHSYLLERKIAIPQPKKVEGRVDFVGGYAKQPQIGLHHWVVSFVFDSLYPSILSQHNISPETFSRVLGKHKMYDLASDGTVEQINFEEVWKESTGQEDNETMCVNGAFFRKDHRGFIPDLVDQFIEERKTTKKKMIELKKAGYYSEIIQHLDNYQKALKILTNGLYGSLGQKYFRWFDIKLAEAVTTTSQLATRYVEMKLNEFLNKRLQTKGVDYVIAADTDSVYLDLETLVNQVGLQGKPTEQVIEFLDKVCEQKLQPFIERCCLDICKTLNVYRPALKMKRDIIANKAIWTAAKYYIANVWDTEGVRNKEPELLIHGIEAIRSSTPMVCRDNIRKSLKIIMNQSEKDLQEFFKTFYREFKQMSFEQIAFPRSVNNLEKWYDPVTLCKKGTPVQVRGTIIYNKLINDMELTKTHSPIRSKDKIRFAYLKEPNPAMSHVIAAPDQLPPELKLNDYIDYDVQWEKSFKAPIQSITDVIGWVVEKKPTLGIPTNKDK